jgi:hypothetical protein
VPFSFTKTPDTQVALALKLPEAHELCPGLRQVRAAFRLKK